MAPWFGVTLTDHGWTEPQATLWLAVLPAGRLLVLPLWALAADRRGAAPVLRTALALAAAATVALVGADPWLHALAILGWAWSRAPAVPIVDALTVARLGTGYGRVRAVGSLAFLLVAAASGALRDRWTSAPIALALVLSFLALALTLALPRLTPRSAARTPRASAWRSLLSHPVFAPLIVVSTLHGAAISIYDSLFAMHVQHLGLPAWVTGAGLALGVGVEVCVLVLGRSLLERVGPALLLTIAVASSIPRFAITALSSDPGWLVAAQSLHGLGFGAYWLAGTVLFASHAPPDLRNSAQALLLGSLFGAGPVLGLGASSIVLRVLPDGNIFALACVLSAVAWLVLLASARLVSGREADAG